MEEEILFPKGYRWKRHHDVWAPVIKTELPSQAMLHLVKRGRQTQCHSDRFSCRRADLRLCLDEEQPL